MVFVMVLLGKYMVDRLYVFRELSGYLPKKSFMYYQNKLSRYKYMGEKTILLLHLHTYYMPSDRHYWGSSFCFLTGNGLFHQFLAVYYQPRLAITLLVERNFIIIALIHQHIAH